MAKTVPVKFVGIKIKVQLEQAVPGSMLKPNFDGMSIPDLTDLIKASKKALLRASFRPTKVADKRVYDADAKLKDLKGTFELDKNLMMVLEGDIVLQASPYAFGIVEDLGEAKVMFEGISLPDTPFLSLSVKDDVKEIDRTIGIAKK